MFRFVNGGIFVTRGIQTYNIFDMKKIFSATLLGLMACACTNENKPALQGEISGLNNDTLLVSVVDMTNFKRVGTDTVVTINGKFEHNLSDTVVLRLSISELGARPLSMTSFYLLPGDKITVKGDISDLKYSGTAIYDKLNEAVEIAEIENGIKALQEEMITLYRADAEGNMNKVDSIGNIIEDKANALYDKKAEFIKANSDELASGIMYLEMSAEKAEGLFELFGEKVKNSPLYDVMSRTKENYDESLARKRAAEKIKPGAEAPAFTLKDLDGKEVSLSSFKGKYVLLDFWGTWCGWCIKGMPDMKEAYQKYKNVMEIVGIDCGDTEERWREGVKEHELPWVNLYNSEEAKVDVMYGVLGYPTKILLDKDGKIVEVFVGESEEMYKKLAEILK